MSNDFVTADATTIPLVAAFEVRLARGSCPSTRWTRCPLADIAYPVTF
jgi:hypothetical protein